MRPMTPPVEAWGVTARQKGVAAARRITLNGATKDRDLGSLPCSENMGEGYVGKAGRARVRAGKHILLPTGLRHRMSTCSKA